MKLMLVFVEYEFIVVLLYNVVIEMKVILLMVILVDIMMILVIWRNMVLIRVYNNMLVIFSFIIGIRRVLWDNFKMKYGKIEVIMKKGSEVEINRIGVGSKVFFKMFWDVEILMEKKIWRMKLNILKVSMWNGWLFWISWFILFLFWIGLILEFELDELIVYVFFILFIVDWKNFFLIVLFRNCIIVDKFWISCVLFFLL